MKFISKLPSLRVVIQTPRRLTDPYSGNPSSTIPGIFAVFKYGNYETTDPQKIRTLVTKINENRSQGFTQLYWVHPEDEDKAKKLYESIRIGGTMDPGGMIQDKDEAMKAMNAEIDRLRKENNRLTGRKVSNKVPVAAGMSETTQDPNQVSETPDLASDDVEPGT